MIPIKLVNACTVLWICLLHAMMDKIGSEVIFLLDLVERINRQEIISNPKEILTWMELC